MLKTFQRAALNHSLWLLGPSALCLQSLLSITHANRLSVYLPLIAPSHLFRQRCAFHTSASTIPAKAAQRSPSAEKYKTGTRTLNLSTFRMDAYNFPGYRLKKKMDDPSKTPLLLVACGSFSPITFLHLRMFVMAADYVKFSTDFEIVGGYLSPVSEAYKKAGLASAEHR